MSNEKSPPILSLIIPTCNDRENLPSLLARINKALEGFKYELIIVDDNSSDRMTELDENLSQKYPIKLIYSKDEWGLTSAIIDGFDKAEGKVLGMMNSDMQHPPEKIPELLQALEDGADIAIASRYISGSGIKGWNTKRKATSRGTAILSRLVLPSVRKVTDPMSCFFLLKRKVIQGIVLNSNYEILLQTLVIGKGDEIKEVPYTEERVHQKDAVNYKKQSGYLKNIIYLASKERELKRFIQFCVVGLSGVGVNMGMFWFLTRVVDLYDLIALIFGLVASITSNFILNEIWTFRDRRTGSTKATLIRSLKFDLVSIGAIAIYYGIYTPLTRFWLGEDNLLALAIVIGIGLIWNFSINMLWTWRKKDTKILTDP